MISLVAFFWIFVILFTIIGAMRGWAKELLVTSAIVLGLFLNAILETYVMPYRTALFLQPGETQIIIRGALLLLLAFFGYQTPQLRALQDKLARERLEELLLGGLLGALNGYLLLGSVWYYMHQAGYPTEFIIWPPPLPELELTVSEMMAYLPPAILTVPEIYFAVGVVFVFIVVVFV